MNRKQVSEKFYDMTIDADEELRQLQEQVCEDKDIDELDENTRFEYAYLESAQDDLCKIQEDLNYYSWGIVDEGLVFINEDGDYQVGNTVVGILERLEVFVYDNYYEKEVWIPGQILCSKTTDEYYFSADPFLKIEGQKARVRRPNMKLFYMKNSDGTDFTAIDLSDD